MPRSKCKDTKTTAKKGPSFHQVLRYMRWPGEESTNVCLGLEGVNVDQTWRGGGMVGKAGRTSLAISMTLDRSKFYTFYTCTHRW